MSYCSRAALSSVTLKFKTVGDPLNFITGSLCVAAAVAASGKQWPTGHNGIRTINTIPNALSNQGAGDLNN